MSAPIYGVEATYQSGRVEVTQVGTDLHWTKTMRNILATAVGRAHPTDGLAAVRLVTAHPVWEEVPEDTPREPRRAGFVGRSADQVIVDDPIKEWCDRTP